MDRTDDVRGSSSESVSLRISKVEERSSDGLVDAPAVKKALALRDKILLRQGGDPRASSSSESSFESMTYEESYSEESEEWLVTTGVDELSGREVNIYTREEYDGASGHLIKYTETELAWRETQRKDVDYQSYDRVFKVEDTVTGKITITYYKDGQEVKAPRVSEARISISDRFFSSDSTDDAEWEEMVDNETGLQVMARLEGDDFHPDSGLACTTTTMRPVDPQAEGYDEIIKYVFEDGRVERVYFWDDSEVDRESYQVKQQSAVNSPRESSRSSSSYEEVIVCEKEIDDSDAEDSEDDGGVRESQSRAVVNPRVSRSSSSDDEIIEIPRYERAAIRAIVPENVQINVEAAMHKLKIPQDFIAWLLQHARNNPLGAMRDFAQFVGTRQMAAMFAPNVLADEERRVIRSRLQRMRALPGGVAQPRVVVLPDGPRGRRAAAVARANSQKTYVDSFRLQRSELRMGLRMRDAISGGALVEGLNHTTLETARADGRLSQIMRAMGITRTVLSELMVDDSFDISTVGPVAKVLAKSKATLDKLCAELARLDIDNPRLKELKKSLANKVRVLEVIAASQQNGANVVLADLQPGKSAEQYASALAAQISSDLVKLADDHFQGNANAQKVVDLRELTTREGIAYTLMQNGHKPKDAKKLAAKIHGLLQRNEHLTRDIETTQRANAHVLQRALGPDGAEWARGRERILSDHAKRDPISRAARGARLAMHDWYTTRVHAIRNNEMTEFTETPRARLEHHLRTAVPADAKTPSVVSHVVADFLRHETNAMRELSEAALTDKAKRGLGRQIARLEGLTDPSAIKRVVGAVHGGTVAEEIGRELSDERAVGYLLSHSDSARALLHKLTSTDNSRLADQMEIELMDDNYGGAVINTIFRLYPNRRQRTAQLLRLFVSGTEAQKRGLLSQRGDIEKQTSALFSLWYNDQLTINDLNSYSSRVAELNVLNWGERKRRTAALDRVADEMVSAVIRRGAGSEKAAYWFVARPAKRESISERIQRATDVIGLNTLNGEEIQRQLELRSNKREDARRAAGRPAFFATHFSEVDSRLTSRVSSDLARMLPVADSKKPVTSSKRIAGAIIEYAQKVERRFLSADGSWDDYLGERNRLLAERVATACRATGLDEDQIAYVFRVIKRPVLAVIQRMADHATRQQVEVIHLDGVSSSDEDDMAVWMAEVEDEVDRLLGPDNNDVVDAVLAVDPQLRAQRGALLNDHIQKEKVFETAIRTLVRDLLNLQRIPRDGGVSIVEVDEAIDQLRTAIEALNPFWQRLDAISRDGDEGVIALANLLRSDDGARYQEGVTTLLAHITEIAKVAKSLDENVGNFSDDQGRDLSDRLQIAGIRLIQWKEAANKMERLTASNAEANKAAANIAQTASNAEVLAMSRLAEIDMLRDA